MDAPSRTPDRRDSADWVQIIWRGPWVWMALVVVFFCVPLFIGLDRTDVENDEAGYSFGVEKMLETGDWLTPRGIYDGQPPFFEKPPLKFWIVALPIRLGLLPASPFGLRFWDALMGSVALLYVFAIGRRLAGPVCGVVAALLLFTHVPLMLNHGLRTNNMEAPLLLQYAGTVYHYLAWRSAGPRGRGHLMAIGLYFVLGFMTKFVAALFAPLVLVLAVAMSPDDRRRVATGWRSVGQVAILAAALIAPWFVYQYYAVGPRLFDLMFGVHVMKRFTAFLDPMHVQPWHYYLTELWGHLQTPAARALVVAGTVLILTRAVRRRWIDGVLVVLWFVVPVAAMSAGTSKLYHYLYPFLPPVALAGGYAAASIADWAWRLFQQPVEVLARARERALPAWSGHRRARAVLTAAGFAALALALATYFAGPLRTTIGPLLLRNSSVIRPLVVGVAAVLAAGSTMATRVMLAAVLVGVALPPRGYGSVLKETSRVSRPLTDLRACLAPIVGKGVGEGRDAPGVWVEAKYYGHIFYYYLRGLGPWQVRPVELASDATVAMRLFAPGAYGPVLMSRDRFGQFAVNLTSNESAVIAAAARKSDLAATDLLELSHRATVARADFSNEILLLPGPYAACATEYFRKPVRDPGHRP